MQLKHRNGTADALHRLEYRIGINFGEVFYSGRKYLGEAINIASRLQAIAPAGGVAISATVRGLIGSASELSFRYAGERRFKNVPTPVQAYFVGDVTLGVDEAVADATGPGIAIRPLLEVEAFQSLSTSSDDGAFAAGLTEEVIALLASLSGSFTVRSARGNPASEMQAAIERSQYYRLSATIRRRETGVMVLARLNRGAEGDVVWAERFECEDGQLGHPEAIANEIVTGIQSTLTEGETILMHRRGTRKLGAWEAFQRGRDFEQRYTRESHLEARAFYQKAIDRDPDFLGAYIALAFCHLDDIRLGWAADVRASEEEAARLHAHARATKPDDAQVLALGGFLDLVRGDEQGALSRLQSAVAKAPRNGELVAYLGSVLETVGRREEALTTYRRAMRLCPHFPAWLATNFGFALCNLGHLHEARKVFRGVVLNHPDYLRAFIGLTVTCVFLDLHDDARDSAAELLRQDPLFTVEAWAASRPYSDDNLVQAYAEAMATAGLP
jgi:adenylate cyclase